MAALIHSVAATVTSPHEIVVVCNGQDASLTAYLRAEPAIARAAFLTQNAGVARGWNIGAHMAVGRWIVIANEDVVFGPGCVDALVQALRDDPSIGIVGPHGETWAISADGRSQRRLVSGHGLVACDMVSGFLFAMPRAALADAGFFDDELSPCSYEELSIARRVRRTGRRLVAMGGLRFEHEYGVSEWDPSREIEYLGRREPILAVNLRNEARVIRQYLDDAEGGVAWSAAVASARPTRADQAGSGRAAPGPDADLAGALRASLPLSPGSRILEVAWESPIVADALSDAGHHVLVASIGEAVGTNRLLDRLDELADAPAAARFDAAVAVRLCSRLSDAEVRLLARTLTRLAHIMVLVEPDERDRDIRTSASWRRRLAGAGVALDGRASARMARSLRAAWPGSVGLLPLVCVDRERAPRWDRALAAALAETSRRRALRAAWRALTRSRAKDNHDARQD